ncbi:cation transporter, partial [Escherichia coli]|uniref:cation transporter n=1 Tax=Escherichia coli TaxID=562 RepID=UPI0013B3F310
DKAEPLGTLLLGVLILISSLMMVASGAVKIFNPDSVENSNLVYGLAMFSCVALLGLVSFQRWVIRRTGSGIIEADSLHYKGDVFLIAGMVVS